MSKLGANGYFRKASESEKFMKLGDLVKDLLSLLPREMKRDNCARYAPADECLRSCPIPGTRRCP